MICTGFTARLVLLTALVMGLGSAPVSANEGDQAVWQSVKANLFGDRPIADGSNLLRIDAPERAQDAALVPITIEALAPQQDGKKIKSITLVVDNNPWPVAAKFNLGEPAGLTAVGTRIRINAYSDVRAIAELEDGSLYHVSRYVKASGGCSAPATKSEEEALAGMGKMILRRHPDKTVSIGDGNAEKLGAATLHIRHPNFSGLQKHPTGNYFIPAHYVKTVEVTQGEKPLLTIEGSIALSENPAFKFHFKPKADEDIHVKAVDSKGNVFTQSWPSQEKPSREASAKPKGA